MMDYHILKGKEVVAVDDLMIWAKASEHRFDKDNKDNWRVNETDVTGKGGGRVSTVFLGLDHQFGAGPPLLFESMYFPGHNDGTQSWADEDCERCSTWEEAEQQHIDMVNKHNKE